MEVKRIREARGLSQSELARASRVKQGVISDIESGKTANPRIGTLKKLAAALSCTVGDLIGEVQP